MGIVRFALRFPHTFYVLAALIVFLGITAIRAMPTDIFPQINIPVVTVIWSYTGLSTPEMEQRVSTYSQYSISSNVNGIKDMESQTLNGISVQKIYFQPDVNLDLAIAQIVSATNAIRALMPPGHPAADHRAVQRLERAGAAAQPHLRQPQRAAALRLRHLSPAPAIGAGARRDLPDAGRRQIPADHGRSRPRQAARARADPARRGQRGQCAEPDAAGGPGQDREHAIHRAHQRHARQHRRAQQHSRSNIANGATVFIKDVGQVRDGSAVQQNIVRENGARAVLLSVIKNGNASTLDVVNGVRNVLQRRARRGASRPQHQRAVRSVGVRQVGGGERGARGRHRRRR